MTFYRDFYDAGCCSLLGQEDLYGFGGLNGYRFEGPYGYYHERRRYGSPSNYRSFGNLEDSRGWAGFGSFYGHGDLYGSGFGYPFFSGFGNRAFY
ncbi:peroxisomal membrane protein PEX13-like [Melanerpes formicivorus]|uniref:peroxisomal membrane protein PEX13-like n=1 Tax=Melanerpes formicivorus TaxID=211600 RepID=UPI00358ECE41